MGLNPPLPVSKDWVPPLDIRVASLVVPALAPEGEAENKSGGPGTSPLENLASQVQAMDPLKKPRPSTVAHEVQKEDEGRQSLSQLFQGARTPVLEAPALLQPQARYRLTSVEPFHWSEHQLAAKIAIPVSQRATNHLIWQLDLAGLSEVIDEESIKFYASLFKGPLAAKSITTIRAMTRLADDGMVKTVAAMAVEELAS
jgi:hypothetical protein